MEATSENVLDESPLASNTPESDDDFDDNDEEILSILPKGKKKKKAGREAVWSNTLLGDAVDIIVNDEVFRKQLIFRNTKNQRNTEVYAKVLEQLKDRAKREMKLLNLPLSSCERSLKRQYQNAKKQPSQ